MMMKGRSNSNASNASNSSFGNSFDQSPLSPPPALNDVPLYKPQSSAAPKQQQPPQTSRPPVAPKPKPTPVDAKTSISNEGVVGSNEAKADKVDSGAASAAGGVADKSKSEPPLPSYNDVMKDVDDTIVDNETTLEEGAGAAGPPLPSYNDIMKDFENKSPTPTSNTMNQDGNGEEQKAETEDG